MKTPTRPLTFAVHLRRIAFLIATTGALLTPELTAADPTLAEVLELGIYSEETKGDLDAAMKLYEQVVSESDADRALAAQAQFRLALCHDKKLDHAAAQAAFEKLIRDYPEQKELVALANEYLADGAALLPAPWTDGEELNLSIKLGTGFEIGVARFTVAADTVENQPVWRFNSTVYANAVSSSHVVADAASLKPVSCDWRHTLVGVTETRYLPGRADVTNKSNGQTKSTDLAGIVYDNEEAIQFMRRLPLAPGYTTNFTVFVGLTGGNTLPLTLTTSGPEEVTVPAGTFSCYKVELSIKQTFWYSADAHRYLVKFEANGVTAELTSVTTMSASPTHLVDNDQAFSIDAPAGWLTFRRRDTQKRTEFHLVAPDGSAQARVKVQDIKDWQHVVIDSPRAYADHELGEARKYVNELKIHDDSWSETTVGGHPAVRVVFDATQGSIQRTSPTIFSVIDGKGIEIAGFLDAKELERFLPALGEIATSYQSSGATP